MRRLTVVHVLASLRPGGAERVATDLLTRLDRDRFAPAALLLYPAEGGPLEVRLAHEGIPVASIEKGRAGFDPRVPVRLLRELHCRRPDVVHTHGYPLGYVLPAWLASRRSVGVHTVHTLASRETRPGPSRALHRIGLRAGVRAVSVSEAVARSVRETYGVTGLVIRNGVDLARFATPAVERAAWRGANGFEDGDLIVATAARLEDEKGPLDLLDAFARVAAEEPRARLAWAGAGRRHGEVVAAARRLGLAERVRLLGQRDDVPDLLHAADVFALASHYEGLGLALVEAAAAGLPAVATRVGGVPEVVRDGDSGVLVPAADPAAFAAALGAMLADPGRRARMAGRAREAARGFALQPMVQAYETLYEQLARSGPVRRASPMGGR
jgi:glycosyltransferase involved in cell wall biosynthesis